MTYLDTLSSNIALGFILYLTSEWETAYSAIARKIIKTQTVIHISMKVMYDTLGTPDLTPSNIAINVSNEVRFIPTRAKRKNIGLLLENYNSVNGIES